jgi:hypothetical protein
LFRKFSSKFSFLIFPKNILFWYFVQIFFNFFLSLFEKFSSKVSIQFFVKKFLLLILFKKFLVYVFLRAIFGGDQTSKILC